MRRVTGSLTATWRALCLLALITGFAAATGLLWLLPPLLQAIALIPGLVVVLLVAVAAYADSSRPSGRR